MEIEILKELLVEIRNLAKTVSISSLAIVLAIIANTIYKGRR